MKIATFNINNVNKRLPNLLAWLKSARPDIVCLQELKAEQDGFPEAALRDAGYRSAWVGQKSWNGVAILAKNKQVVVTRTRLPGDPKDREARYIEAAVGGIVIACLYAPNGNPQPGPKFDNKLAWMKRLHRHAGTLLKSGAPVVIAGDFNVAPTPLDIYPTKSWNKDALIQPDSRSAYREDRVDMVRWSPGDRLDRIDGPKPLPGRPPGFGSTLMAKMFQDIRAHHEMNLRETGCSHHISLELLKDAPTTQRGSIPHEP